MESEVKLLSVSPSMFRGKPIRFMSNIAFIILGLILSAARKKLNEDLQLQLPEFLLPVPGVLITGIASLYFLRWWIKSITTRLVVTSKKVVRYEGLIARHMIQMRHSNIQNVYIKQGVFQRLMGCGIIGLSSSGQANVEIVVEGIPHPGRVVAQIQEILNKDDTS